MIGDEAVVGCMRKDTFHPDVVSLQPVRLSDLSPELQNMVRTVDAYHNGKGYDVELFQNMTAAAKSLAACLKSDKTAAASPNSVEDDFSTIKFEPTVLMVHLIAESREEAAIMLRDMNVKGILSLMDSGGIYRDVQMSEFLALQDVAEVARDRYLAAIQVARNGGIEPDILKHPVWGPISQALARLDAARGV